MANPYFFPAPYHPPIDPQSVGQVGNQYLTNIPQAGVPNIQPVNQQAPPNYTSPRGFNYSGLSGALAGGAALAAQTIGMANQGTNVNTQLPPSQYDPTSRPRYSGGQLVSQARNIDTGGASEGDVLSAAATGAGAGVAFGGIGAAAGAVIGAGAALISGGARSKKNQQEQSKLLNTAKAAGQAYNKADVSFRNRSAAMEDYYQRTNATNRLHNLYRSQL